MLEYSEYKKLVDILEKSVDYGGTYQELMNKEEKVLDTINKVIKVYKDDDVRKLKYKSFVDYSIHEATFKFFNVWIEMFNEIVAQENILHVLQKEDRLVYIGLMMILLSVCIYFSSM
jgi:hypothetical protein